jgi:hypothetical protein
MRIGSEGIHCFFGAVLDLKISAHEYLGNIKCHFEVVDADW